MWTTTQAIALIRDIHPAAFAAGWNLHLGGGLLTKADVSHKDADIVAIPRFQTEHHDQEALLKHLAQKGWRKTTTELLPNKIVYSLRKQHQVLELIFLSFSQT